MDLYQQYIHASRYARWNPDKGRRETWDETVRRVCDYLADKHPKYKDYIDTKVYDAIYDMDVMPSMRLMMTAGEAADRDNGVIYNCGYTPIECITDFVDLMSLLMNGTGGGFSVEKHHVNQLPTVSPMVSYSKTYQIKVKDSKQGWLNAFNDVLQIVWHGAGNINIDYSDIRPKGAKLSVMGGRASGPEPLKELIEFTIELLRKAKGRKLRPAEVHHLCCKIASVVVVGGVRRSALISLSDFDDEEMKTIKDDIQPGMEHLYLANNSAVYTSKPGVDEFSEEMMHLYESKSGERGIFNRESARAVAAREGRRSNTDLYGTNPCSEIILRPRQFCNLTEVVVRPEDTLEELIYKAEIASFLGTLQATFTNFPTLLHSGWQKNTEEERLLGVSLTGIMDHPVLNKTGGDELKTWLVTLRKRAREVNEVFAKDIGIPVSTAITCIKPSGTVSQLVDSASGIHDRYAPYYMRRVVGDNKDPVTQALKEKGVWNEPSVSNPEATVFTFYKKAPDSAAYLTPREKFEQWLFYQKHWCEHKPSVTINYSDEDFTDLVSDIYSNWDNVSGISLLPGDDHVYAQAPYEKISASEYSIACKLDATQLNPEPLSELISKYEVEDETKGTMQLSCSAGVCDI